MRKRLRVSADLSFRAEEAVESVFGILGKRGGGKTAYVKVFLEAMLRADLPFIVLDPMSLYWGLRSTMDGAYPSGHRVLVVGGPKGDIPIDPARGEALAKVILELDVSTVIDYSDLKGSEYRRFLTAFCDSLYRHNTKSRHVVIEESPVLLPQKVPPNRLELYEAVERLTSRGRNKGIGVTLMSQRAATVAKDALSVAPWMRIPLRCGKFTALHSLEDFWASQTSREKQRTRIRKVGNIEYLDLGRGHWTICFKNGMGTWAPIRRLIRHPYKGDLIRLFQKWGEVVVTPNHSVYAADGSLARPQDNPELLAVRWINQQRAREATSVRLQLPDSNFTLEEDGWFRDKTLARARSKTKMKQFLDGEDLSAFLRFLGAWISEGSTHGSRRNGTMITQIANTDKAWLESLQNDMSRFFSTRGNIVKAFASPMRTKQCWSLAISSRTLGRWLIAKCGKGADNKYLPPFVFGLTWEYAWELIKSMVKGDGCYYRGENWKYFSKSQKLIQDLGFLLSLHGKGFTLSQDPKTKVYTLRRGDWYQNYTKKKTMRMERIPFEGYVYDVEIEDKYGHNFVVGPGNVVVHNSQIDAMVVFGIIAPSDRKALMEWVEAKADEQDLKDFEKGLATLHRREAWVWSPEKLNLFQPFRVRTFTTYHPDLTHLRRKRIRKHNVRMTDMSDVVAQLPEEIRNPEVVKQRDTMELEVLRLRVKDLEEELAKRRVEINLGEDVRQALADDEEGGED